jgi:pyruvate dehydrogenase kinase 2/3/4
MLEFEYLTKACRSFRVNTAEGHCDVSHSGGGLHTPENPIEKPDDLFSFSHIRNATRMEDQRLGALRTFSASPEGVRATVGEQVGRWQNTSPNQVEGESLHDPKKDAEIGLHPRIGMGLPMSNIFATCVISVQTGCMY